MTEWAPKRFWTAAHVREEDGGFAIALDSRPVRTPGKTPLVVPTRAMAQAIAAEWDAQTGKVDPRCMPVTRAANSALDKVTPFHGDVADMLAAYGDSDLLCYRAEAPAELVAREAAAWDPYLDWAAERLGARLAPRTGIMHVAQDAEALERLRARVHELDAFELTGFHDLVTLSGSLILAFAAVEGVAEPDALWETSRVDEIWQQELWGVDEEAQEAANLKKSAFLQAHAFYRLARSWPEDNSDA